MSEQSAEPVFASRRERRMAEETGLRSSRRLQSLSTSSPAPQYPPAAVRGQVGAGAVAFRGSDGSIVRGMRRRRAVVTTALAGVSLAGAAAAVVLISGNGTGQAQAAEPNDDAPVLTALGSEAVSTDVGGDADAATGRTASGSAPSAKDGDVQAAGRSITKTVLPGCSEDVDFGDAGNGELPESWMCDLGVGEHKLRADAAIAFSKMNAAYKEDTGEDMELTDTYRSLESQVSVAGRKPGLAARAGTSLHGWGIAIDFGGGTGSASGQQYDWLVANGAEYGWENPDWAKGSQYEPWHWEYVPARKDIKGA
ncbi:M15 family metallopeptidase [Brevibacterium jeotgali]|uniref:D-alanyl-D-alanine carboxypeptidase n=1 Tax=Brevibacterium jeotgali TaxID=1262550 RepID=A0A2H1L1L8_9MICO|nr:M15 family metallopeptidase [Brevibacterium jeotgali]TWC02781.1 D-alanyl-D-alanine carboxypeptidase-like protein [Brevibacterium jeotgali]SMY10801.1 D-alanyl-D-alanine carboxypeptidase [Brevibacterium jeotgali]